MVEELLRNSLDKAYGKQGNPCAPGWLPCLETWVRAEPSVLCQGLGSPPSTSAGTWGGLLEPGKGTWPGGCWGCRRVGCWRGGLQPLARSGAPAQVGARRRAPR